MKSTLQLRATEEDQANELEPEGTHVLSALLEGIQSDFQSMVRTNVMEYGSVSADDPLSSAYDNAAAGWLVSQSLWGLA